MGILSLLEGVGGSVPEGFDLVFTQCSSCLLDRRPALRAYRAVTGHPGGISRLYKAIATILIESCALLAVNSLLGIGLLFTDNFLATNTFLTILGEIQVRVFPRL